MALGAYALDQLTKHLALAHLDPASPPSYLGGLLRLRLMRNSGAAFSMGSSSTVVFSLLAIVALVVVLGFVVPRVRTVLGAITTGLALAGIAGNLTDRLFRAPGVLRGWVIDFISLPHFAIFNVADVCITVTAVLVVLQQLRPQPASGARTVAPGEGAAATGDAHGESAESMGASIPDLASTRGVEPTEDPA